MRFFSKNIDLYNVGQWARRAGVRMMGLVVALFASARADAANGFLGSACPGCVENGYSVCDNNSSKMAYDDGTGIGTQYIYCIRAQSDGYSTVINDSGCVALLKSWGMCNPYQEEFLYTPNLNCTSGASYERSLYVEWQGNTYDYMQDNGCGYVMFYAQSANDPYLCCNTVGGIGNVSCCASESSCYDDYMYGACNGSMVSAYLYENGDNGASQTCTPAFEDYFSNEDYSTGRCKGSGIVVEATGAMLIAQACWGATTMRQADMYGMETFCGVVITGCDAENGYWFNGKEASTLIFANSGSSYWCSACPAPVSGYDSGHNFSINGGTGIGVGSCYATAGTASVSLTDTTGTYQETITANCPYTE